MTDILTQSWNDFIHNFQEQEGQGVIAQILKKTSVINRSDDKITISCDNLGIKILLENKHAKIASAYKKWSGADVIFEFVIAEKKQKKGKPTNSESPLIQLNSNREKLIKKTGLIDSYTFKNYAVSPSNQIAFSAGERVAENPGKLYNPFFIYGSVGVGKTHLMHAIAHHIFERDFTKKIVYCTSEEFTNDLVDSIKTKNTNEFRKKYRDIDVLLIDDIQFIAGKNYIQEEFYHTFNSLIKRGGQIILTSEKPPKDIVKLEDRLRSRFSGGLTIDIQKPDFELRSAILLIKAQERNISINVDIAKRIAEYIDDTRELEGKLLEIYTKSLKSDGSITLDKVDNELASQKDTALSKITPNDVIKLICSYFSVTQTGLRSSSRKENLALPRQIVMYILRTIFKLKYDDIGIILKRKDHTTIMHGVEKITALYLKDPIVKNDIDAIIKALHV